MLTLAVCWGLSDVYYLVFPYQPGVETTETSPKNEFMVGGVQMNEGNQDNWVRALKSVGMNTVEVTVYAQQGRWDENNVWYYEDESGVLEEIRRAKDAGMKVVLILRLQMDHAFASNSFLWHGMVFPSTDYMVQRWFEEYGRFTKKWARVSEAEGVDVLVLGSEMNAVFSTIPTADTPQLHEYYLNEEKQKKQHDKLLKFKDRLSPGDMYAEGVGYFDSLEVFLQEQSKAKREWALQTAFTDSTNPLAAINMRRKVLNWYWERMIYELRGVYNGKMTIAANFDNYQEVQFWDKLDFIGINAYFPLRQLGEKPSYPVLRASWDRILEDALAFRDSMGIPRHPFLFTELGYGRHSGSTFTPWQGFGFSLVEREGMQDSLLVWKEQETDQVERNTALRALYQSVKAKRFPLAGILYWKLTSKKDQLKYDPFALHIGLSSRDTLQALLVRFKGLKAIVIEEMIRQAKASDSIQ